MDIKAKVGEIVERVKSDKDFAAKFSSNPAQAIKGIIGVDLPDEQINAIIDGVKAKITLAKADDTLGSIKKLF